MIAAVATAFRALFGFMLLCAFAGVIAAAAWLARTVDTRLGVIAAIGGSAVVIATFGTIAILIDSHRLLQRIARALEQPDAPQGQDEQDSDLVDRASRRRQEPRVSRSPRP